MTKRKKELDLEDNGPQIKIAADLHSLINDCKEMIFRKCNLSDLLSISDSCKQFHPMACQIFKDKYSNGKVTIDQLESVRNCVVITTPLSTLSLLRNFGHLITNLHINFALFSVHLCEQIEQYLVKYCGESLSHVSFNCHPRKELFKNIREPFSNVYSIVLQSCCFLRSNAAYNNLFPRLRYLQVDANVFEIRSSINSTMPSLTSVAMLEDFDEDEIVNALKLNPQIVKLLLVANYNSQIIRNLNNYLPNLKYLCLRELPKEFNETDFEPVNFENLLDISVSYGPDTLERFPFKLSRVQHLSIAGRIFLDRKWYRLIESLNLKSIGLFDVSCDTNNLLGRIRSGTQNVNISTISTMNTVSASSVTDLLSHNSSTIKNLTLTSKQTDFNRFIRNIISATGYHTSSFPHAQQFKCRY